MRSPTIEPLEARIAPATITAAPQSFVEGQVDKTVNFVVNLDTAAVAGTKVNYAFINGSATAADYTGTAGTLDFATGATSANISFTIKADTLLEATEQFQIRLSNPVNATLGTTQAAVTIADIDQPVNFRANPASITEGAEGFSTAVFSLVLGQAVPAGFTLVVDYTTANPAAGPNVHAATPAADAASSAGKDYVQKSGSVVFEAGSRTQTVGVQVVGDNVLEFPEQFLLNFSHPRLVKTVGSTTESTDVTFASSSVTSATGTIRNDENSVVVVSVTPDAATLAEGAAADTTQAQFTVRLSSALTAAVSVPYSFSNSLTSPPTTGSITIAAGQTTGTIFAPFMHDGAVGHDQVLTVSLTAAPAAQPAANASFVLSNTAKTAVTTVLDDDARLILVPQTPKSGQPQVGEIAEGNSGTTNLIFVAKLVDANGAAVTLDHAVQANFATVDGTATGSGAQADFVGGSGTLTIAPGEAQILIPVKINGDTLAGASETFDFKLSNAVGATLSGTQATATGVILNDDGASPVLSISSPSAVEGGNATFALTLSRASDSPITVDYARVFLAGTSAANAADFPAGTVSGTLTFAPGQTTMNVVVPVQQDATNEGAETFGLQLSNPANVTINPLNLIQPLNGTQQVAGGTGTIAASDQPIITIASVGKVEGNSGNTNLDFVIALKDADGNPFTANEAITFDFNTVAGTATAGDFVPKSVSVTIQQNESSGIVSVQIAGDAANEADEQFTVRLSNAQHATFAGGAATLDATGTILNDDASFTVVSADANGTVAETGKFATFKVRRTSTDTNFPGGASVLFETVDGSAKGSAPSDFTPTVQILTFAANEVEKTIQVPILDDARREGPERFSVKLSNAQGGIITTATATEIITDNEVLPTVVVKNAPSVTEGDAGQGNMVFTITLDRAAGEGEAVTLNYSTADGTAKAGQDYVALANETLTFDAGQNTKTVTVKVTNELVFDSARSETVKLVVTNTTPATATLGKNAQGVPNASLTATGAILDNETAPVLSVSAGELMEGADGLFTVTASRASDNPIVVRYYTTDGTAKAGSDFTGVSSRTPQTVTIAAGQTSAAITVPLLDDDVTEPAESFRLQLAGVVTAGSATLSPVSSFATGTIVDNDLAAITINDVQIVEGDSGTKDAVFTVSMQGKTAQVVTLNYATVDGTALAGSDFEATSGRLVLTPDASGETSTGTIVVRIFGDLGKEADETFMVKLTDASLGTLVKDTGLATIANGTDTRLTVSVTDATVVEGDVTITGTGSSQQVGFLKPVEFTASLSEVNHTGAPITFQVLTQDLTRLANVARAGSDYVALRDPANSLQPLTLSIADGEQTATFTVNIVQDTVFEATEFFNVRLANINGAEPGKAVGTVTVYDDDLYLQQTTARWTDPDGDIVTLQVSKGSLFAADLSFKAENGEITESALGGRTLAMLDLVKRAGQGFFGADVSITADQQPDAAGGKVGNGRVDVGYIRANDLDTASSAFEVKGIDLRNVTIDGDLSRISAGDIFNQHAVNALNVFSLGVNSEETDPQGDELNADGSATGFTKSAVSILIAGATSVTVTDDVEGTLFANGGASGIISVLKVGGTLRGGGAESSGRISVSGSVTLATIGEIVGGAGRLSGSLSGSDGLAGFGTVKITGSIVGGSGAQSGSILGARIGAVTVGDSVHGGIIGATSTLGSVTVAHDLDGGAHLVGGGIGGLGDNIAIGTVIVRGRVDEASILGGFTVTASEPDLITGLRSTVYQPVSADAQIGTVQVDGAVAGLDIGAGANPAGGVLIGVTNNPAVFSKIARVVLNGPVEVNATNHFITAQSVGTVLVEGVARAISGSLVEVAPNTKFFIHLV